VGLREGRTLVVVVVVARRRDWTRRPTVNLLSKRGCETERSISARLNLTSPQWVHPAILQALAPASSTHRDGSTSHRRRIWLGSRGGPRLVERAGS